MTECMINISKKVNSSAENTNSIDKDEFSGINYAPSINEEDKKLDSYKEFNELYQKSVVKIISNNNYVYFGLSKRFISLICPNFIVERRGILTYYGLKFGFLIMSIMFYILSLEGCPKEQNLGVCMGQAGYTNMLILIKRMMYSLICCSLVIILSQKHFITFLTLFPTFTYLLFFYDNGTDLYNHGYYNSTFFIFALPVSIVLLLICKLTIIGLYNKFLRTASILLVSLISFYLIYDFITSGTCDYWSKGFKNTFINDSLSKCKTIKPDTCWFKILDETMDLPKYLGQDCTQMKNYLLSEDLLLSNSNLKNKGAKYIGFPRTENWKTIEDTSYWQYQTNILNGLVDLEDPTISEEIKNNTEFTIDFRNSTKEVPFIANLTLKKNYTLEKERLEMEQAFRKTSDKIPIFKNILILFTDSLSRAHFRRKLPKTFKYLEERYYSYEERKRDKNNKARKDEVTRSYQFLKFHAQSSATIENVVPLLYGVYRRERGVSIFDHHKNAGYVIGTSQNYCGRELADYDLQTEVNLQFPRYDHEFNQIMCDPNLHSLDQPYSIIQGPYSMSLKCIWGKKSFEWIVDYAKQFYSAYRNNSKLFLIGNIDSHEGSGEVIKYDDDVYLDYFKWMEAEGFMKDTFILVYSDHGFRMPGYLYGFLNLQDFHLESYLPAVFILLPTETVGFDKMDKFLMKNENKLMLPWDLNSCLEFNVKKNAEYDYYQCPFLKVIKEKTCKFWELDADECRCTFNNEK